jgi:L-fuculose-phosphate aldolase
LEFENPKAYAQLKETDMLLQEERQMVVRYGLGMVQAGLTTGTGGNLSCRGQDRGLVAISPSGVPYDEVHPRDVVVVDLAGNIVDGHLKPSSEIGFHLILYNHRPNIGGIVHTHSVYATTLACLNREIPPVHYLIGSAGPKVPVAPYATFGTASLAEHIWRTMGTDYQAALLANHGLVAVGRDLPKALDTAANIEFVARVFCQAQSIGSPTVLSEEAMAQVIAKFETYGIQDRAREV